jgi:two-component system KDP operon response regulator KdpE
MNIVVIEDDESIIDAIKISFQVGWPDTTIISAQTGEAGLRLIESQSPSAVILDLGLPDMSGFEVLKAIRLFSVVPVIILTVHGEEKNIVKGLETGADDYVTKPFSQLELLARIKAAIRSRHPDTKQVTTLGSFHFDTSGRHVSYMNKQISLTSTEYILLRYLLLNRGIILSYEQLAQQLWGNSYPGCSRTIGVYISHLRKKIEDTKKEQKIIISHPGIGYSISKDCT